MSPKHPHRRLTAASTADAAAAMRAAGAAEPDERVRNPDHMARRFVDRGVRLTMLAKIPLVRRVFRRLPELVVPGMYYYETARVKHMDAVLRGGLDAGIEQLVILGAGYDTRPYRFEPELRGARVFEVDQPLASARKQAKVERILGRLPDHVKYVQVDFNTGDIAKRLAAAGYDSGRRTFFIWSGVTFYVTEEAVDRVLACVRGHSPPGSCILFDYVYREMLEDENDAHGARQLKRKAADLGEPLTFGIDESAVRDFLAERGFELISDLGPRELEQRYLTRSDGRSYGRPYGFASIAHARVR